MIHHVQQRVISGTRCLAQNQKNAIQGQRADRENRHLQQHS